MITLASFVPQMMIVTSRMTWRSFKKHLAVQVEGGIMETSSSSSRAPRMSDRTPAILDVCGNSLLGLKAVVKERFFGLDM